MKHKGMFRRLLSVLLCLTMVFSLLPTSALAEGLEEPVAAPGEEPAQSDNGSFNLKIEYLSEGKDKLAEAYEVSAAKDAAFEGEVSFPEVSGYRPAKVEFGEVKAENVLGAENEVLVYGECANVALNEAKNALVLSGAAVADVHVIVTYAAVAAGEPVEEQPAEEQQPAKAPAKAPLSIVDPVPAIDTYNFVVDGETVSTQRVKEGETVYAPASPEKAGYKFVGWFEGDAAFAAGAKTGVAGIEHTVTARFEEIHYVFFLNDEGVVSTTKEGTNGDVIAADAKFPVDADKAITGWYTDADLTNKVESVTLTDSNIILYPKVETGSWITFNSDGGTYVEPVFVAPGTATVAPAAPTRIGYTFQGWYNGNDEFAFGNTLSENVTLTARWQGNANTQYTVIHFQENANDDNYSFAEAETLTGTAGQTTTASAKAYDGFTAQAIEQKTIAGDGSTIVSVYYTRNVCTIYFFPTNGGSSALTCTKEAHTHGWGCYEWQDWNRVLTCTKEEHTHDNSCYTYSAEGSLFTITAKQGAYIGDQWPSRSNGSTNWSTKKNGGAPYQAGIDVMPLNGGVFYTPTSESTDNSQTASYYVEVLDGEDGITVSGKKYKLDHTDTVRLSGPTVSDEDFYDITGFTKNKTISTKNGNNYDGAKFYYTRNSYNIKFINNGTVEKTVAKQYQANISDVTYTPNRPAGMPAEYNFVGWYDNELGQGEPYSFTGTMPAQNITVYAKWAAPVFTGIVHMQMAGNGETHTFEIVYGSKIDESKLPEIVIPEGYTWRGWATRDEQGNYTPFNFETEIYADITLYPYYTSNQAFSVNYGAGEGSGTVPVDAKRYADGSYADVMAATGLTAPEGKVFLGWEADGKVYQPGDKIAVHASNIVLTAVWGDKASTAVVTYHANGGVGDDVTSACPNNSEITLIANPFTREGYEFIGWATAPDAAAPYMQPGVKVVVDNTPSNDFYAMWKLNEFNITYRYTGDAPESAPAAPGASKGVYNTTIDVATVPTLDGYTFSGWTTADAVVENGQFTMPDHDVAFTGSWSIRSDLSYTVHYYWNGTEESVADDIQVSGRTFNETYTESPKAVDGCTAVSNDSKSVTITTGTNEIIFYYYKNVTLTANSDTKSYNGEEQTVSGFTGAPEGVTFEGVTASGSGTDVGEYAVSFSEGAVGKVDTTAKYIVTAANPGKLTIVKSAIANYVTLKTADAEKPYDGTALVAGTATAADKNGKTVKVEYQKADGTWTEDPADITATDVADSKTVNVRASVEGSYTGYVTGTQKLTITKRPVTVTTESGSKVYDGTALTAPGEVEGIVEGETYTFTVTGTQTIVGDSINTYTMAFDGTAKENNYTISEALGTLTVTDRTEKYEITVVANSHTDTYDGNEKRVSGLKTLTFTVNGQTYTVEGLSASATGTDAGTYAAAVTGTAVVKDVKGNDVTNQFEVNTTNGTLTINKRSVTLTSESGSKPYDGTALTKPDVAMTGDGFVEGEVTGIIATGSVTNVAEGEVTNTITFTAGEKFNVDNYSITKNEGKLTVTANTDEVTVTITGNSATEVYNAAEQSVTGYTTDVGDKAITVALAEGKSAEAKGTNVGTYAMNLTEDSFVVESDNYSNIKVVVVDGSLTITPVTDEVTVTITGNNATKTYTGSELSVTGFTTDVNGKAINVALAEGAKAEAKGTDVGTYEMGLTKDSFVVESKNYSNIKVVVVDGKLTIAPVTDEVTVTITGNSDSKTYTGSEQSVEGYTTDVGEKTINVALAEGAKAEAKGTDVGTYEMGLTKDSFVVTSDNYSNIKVVVVDGKLTIAPVTDEVTVTITGNSDSKTYTGSEQSVTGFTTDVNGKAINVALAEGAKAEAKGTDVGTYEMGLTKDSFVVTSDNYSNIKVVVVDGKLTIAPVTDEVTVTITGNSDSKTYTGSEQSVEGYTTDVGEKTINVALAEGAKAEAKGTNVDTYKMGLTEDSFVVESENYKNIKVVVVDGALTITPIETEYVIKVSGKTDTVTYTGKEQSVTGYTVSDYDSSITLTGPAQEEAIAKGTNAGTYQMNLKAEDFSASSDNYTSIRVEVEDGALTITPTDAEYVIKVSGKTDTVTYNGKEQSVTGYTVSDYDSSITLTGPAQDAAIAKGTNVDTYEMGLKAEDFSASSDNYTNIRVEVEDGWLKITNASIVAKFTGESKSVTYNGKEQEITGITAEGLLEGHEYENLSYSAKGTDADTYNGVFSGVVKIVDANGTDVTENYAVETVPGTLTITPVTDEVTVTITGNNDSQVYDGKAHDVTGYKVSISNPLYTEGDFSFSGTASASGTNVDTYKMGLSADMFANTSKNFSKVTFNVTDGYVTITKRPVTVTGDGWDVDQLYTGKEYKKDTYTFANVVDGQTATITYSIKGTEVDTYTGEFGEDFLVMSGDTEVTANYELTTKTPGTLNIVKSAIAQYVTLTPKDVEETYDGNTYTAAAANATDSNDKTVKVEYQKADGTWTEDPADITATNVADSVIVNVRASVEGSYEGYVEGTQELTINPRNVTLTSETASKPYDGTPLTRPDVAVTGDGFVDGEVTDIKATGSVTTVADGVVTNTITYTASGNFKAENYEISISEGTLTITAIANEIVITANSNNKTYDGTPLTDNGYSYTKNVLAEGDVLTAVVEGSQTDAGSSENVVTSYMVMRGETDVTANYTISTKNGTLTVTAKEVTVTADNKSKVYGEKDPELTATVTGLVEGESLDLITYDVTRATGENVGDYTITPAGEATQGNYTVTYKTGTLTITAKTIKPDPENPNGISVNDPKDHTYDGAEHKFVPEVKDGETVLLEDTDYTVTYDTKNFTDVNGTITVTVTGKGNYQGEVTRTYKILPREVNLTSESAIKVYDGTPLTRPEVTGGDSFVAGEVSDLTATGSITEVGSVANTITYTEGESFKADNYNITKDEGTLTIVAQSIDPEDPREPDPENPDQPVYGGVEIGNLADVVYNGQSWQKRPAVTGEDGNALDEGTDYTLAWSADTVNVGTVTVTVTGKGNYQGEVTRTYKILPREVNLTSESAIKVYDGTPLTRPEVTGGDSFVAGEVSDLTATGSITEVGSVANTITYTEGESFKADNYNITKDEGTLTIVAQSIDPKDPTEPDPENPDQPVYGGVEIGNLADVVYNGESQAQKPTVTAKDGNALDEGTDYTLAWSADTVNVGTVTVTVTGKGNYAGTVERTYRITPATVIVTADSKAKTFNSADPALTATVTGLIGTDTVEYTLARAAGEDVGNYAITAAGAEIQGNYIVRFVPGTMVITGFIDDPPVVDIPELPPLPEAIDDELTPLGGPEVTVDDPVNIDDEATPLAGEHECCILHFLILCAALLIELLYINDKKKRQQKIFEMRRELNK